MRDETRRNGHALLFYYYYPILSEIILLLLPSEEHDQLDLYTEWDKKRSLVAFVSAQVPPFRPVPARYIKNIMLDEATLLTQLRVMVISALSTITSRSAPWSTITATKTNQTSLSAIFLLMPTLEQSRTNTRKGHAAPFVVCFRS